MREISGDKPLTKKEKIIYLLFNFIRGIAGYRIFLKTRYWHPQKIENGKNSPGREYSNQFFSENLVKLLSAKEIKVLDIGCGSGYIRKVFYDLGYRLDYTGIDIIKDEDFEKFNRYTLHSDFIKTKIEEFNTSDRYDFIISISALEHIKDDMLTISKSSQLLKPTSIQIHIVPTFWSLFLYLWHGCRQYTPARLKKMFEGKNFKVYRLGGFFSFFLHLFFITIPEIIFKSNKPRSLKTYPKLIDISNKLDVFIPIFSSMYIMVLKGNCHSNEKVASRFSEQMK